MGTEKFPTGRGYRVVLHRYRAPSHAARHARFEKREARRNFRHAQNVATRSWHYGCDAVVHVHVRRLTGRDA